MLDRLEIARDSEHGLDHARDNLIAALHNGKLEIDMSTFIGYDSVYSGDPSSLTDEEFIDVGTEYKVSI